MVTFLPKTERYGSLFVLSVITLCGRKRLVLQNTDQTIQATLKRPQCVLWGLCCSSFSSVLCLWLFSFVLCLVSNVVYVSRLGIRNKSFCYV
jgi:hypothetical protein